MAAFLRTGRTYVYTTSAYSSSHAFCSLLLEDSASENKLFSGRRESSGFKNIVRTSDKLNTYIGPIYRDKNLGSDVCYHVPGVCDVLLSSSVVKDILVNISNNELTIYQPSDIIAQAFKNFTTQYTPKSSRNLNVTLTICYFFLSHIST